MEYTWLPHWLSSRFMGGREVGRWDDDAWSFKRALGLVSFFARRITFLHAPEDLMHTKTGNM
eukprot:2695191-Amphidinium_carterae.1